METKVCPKCSVVKKITDYTFKNIALNLRHSRCRECSRAADRAVYSLKKSNGTLKPNTRVSPNKKVNQQRYEIKRYGITVEEYEDLILKTNGQCYICDAPPPNGKRNHIDHDHVTGKVRGILCYRCNHAIGLFKDSPTLLLKAKAYLLEDNC